MSQFNKFSEAFDDAINIGDEANAENIMLAYVQACSAFTGAPLQQCFNATCGWMSYPMGGNREVDTRNTELGRQAIDNVEKKIAQLSKPQG